MKTQILNKQGDTIIELEVGSWEHTYWSMLVDSDNYGIPALSEKRCAQLLVWVFVYGGSCEAVTQNKKMYIDIVFAQHKFNIHGAEIPDSKLIKYYYNELKSAETYPDWVDYIAKKYNIKMDKFSKT